MGKLRSIARWSLEALIPAVFLLSPWWNFAAASDGDRVTEDRLVRFWDEAKTDSLRLTYSSFAADRPDNPVALFVQAALEKDGHLAARDYQKVVDIGGNSSVVPRAMHRLTQYFRSIGNLTEASTWEERLRTEHPDFQAPLCRPVNFQRIDCPYTLQLGAFEHLRNAQKLSQKAESSGLACEIQQRIVDGRTLYFVCAGQFATEDDAQSAGEKLLRPQRMTYRVVARRLQDR